MDFVSQELTPKKAENILYDLYNIQGKAVQLHGYIDFNFKISGEDGSAYILKISRPDEDEGYLDFQQQLLHHLKEKGVIAPLVIADKKGNHIVSFTDTAGHCRSVRMLSWISGRLWSDVNPQLDVLRFSLGNRCGKLSQALQGFDHPQARRKFEWDISESLWTKEHLKLFSEKESALLAFFQDAFEKEHISYASLRKSVVHNDVNDNNIIVSEDPIHPTVKAIIDFGDAVYTQIINDLAIACAYAIMGHHDPLAAALPIVEGYHSAFPLNERELDHLYTAIAMRLVVSVTKSALGKRDEPENTYLSISEKPAWELLEKWRAISPAFARYSFRMACGFHPHPKEKEFKDWALQHEFSIADLFPAIAKNEAHLLDLSVSSRWIGQQADFDDLDLLQFKLDRLQRQHPKKILAGGYLEPRAVYTTSEYGRIGNSGPENRTIHLGTDFWLPAGTVVSALFDGEVVTAVNDAGNKEYGGLIILKHTTGSFDFFTLYGHLSLASIASKSIGQSIAAGERIGFLGNPQENGNWAPHLHFQLMLSMLGYSLDFPGVAYASQIEVWESICPDPNLLFKTETLHTERHTSNEELINYRKRHLGKSLSLLYDRPLKIVRGAGQYLIDQNGRKFLDTVNNVAHVGHEHPAVVKAGQEQMALLNTNTRYLHDSINTLTEELLETLPPELSVLHFVNSGSEANELAIRMVQAATGERDIIASEVGYHGNSNMTVAISSYKFDGKGGNGAPEHTHIFPLPDAFRGKYQGENAGQKYAEEVQRQIDVIQGKGRGVAAIIMESIISCGGQIELPDRFLVKAYEYVRASGGLCIADEVQTGCGRVGKTFWGFQLHGVIPDIVTIGKPLGNGHPVAAVACTKAVAEKFANGMEYFNTFGGNPVSCAIAAEVLRTVKREKLQEHALKVGEFLKSGLQSLAKDFPIIGDVRGQGLFLGIELVDSHKNPLGDRTGYLANRIKDHGILMGTDGPDHNVLKIKPPMVFTQENAAELLFYLDKVLREDFMQG